MIPPIRGLEFALGVLGVLNTLSKSPVADAEVVAAAEAMSLNDDDDDDDDATEIDVMEQVGMMEGGKESNVM